jgi:gluconokinase
VLRLILHRRGSGVLDLKQVMSNAGRGAWSDPIPLLVIGACSNVGNPAPESVLYDSAHSSTIRPPPAGAVVEPHVFLLGGTAASMGFRIVIMGVAGCGKSSLGAAVAAAEGVPLIEGDDFHSQASRDKMARGTPLTDADRAEWLQALAAQLATQPGGMVLTCSALKRAYRDLLRARAAGLRFVFLEIGREAAQQRVASRASHFFSASLVESQFATLESPVGEEGVLRLDALEPLPVLQRRVAAWLHAPSPD